MEKIWIGCHQKLQLKPEDPCLPSASAPALGSRIRCHPPRQRQVATSIGAELHDLPLCHSPTLPLTTKPIGVRKHCFRSTSKWLLEHCHPTLRRSSPALPWPKVHDHVRRFMVQLRGYFQHQKAYAQRSGAWSPSKGVAPPAAQRPSLPRCPPCPPYRGLSSRKSTANHADIGHQQCRRRRRRAPRECIRGH